MSEDENLDAAVKAADDLVEPGKQKAEKEGLTFDAEVIEVGLGGLVIRVLNEHQLWAVKRQFDRKRVVVSIRE